MRLENRKDEPALRSEDNGNRDMKLLCMLVRYFNNLQSSGSLDNGVRKLCGYVACPCKAVTCDMAPLPWDQIHYAQILTPSFISMDGYDENKLLFWT